MRSNTRARASVDFIRSFNREVLYCYVLFVIMDNNLLINSASFSSVHIYACFCCVCCIF